MKDKKASLRMEYFQTCFLLTFFGNFGKIKMREYMG